MGLKNLPENPFLAQAKLAFLIPCPLAMFAVMVLLNLLRRKHKFISMYVYASDQNIKPSKSIRRLVIIPNPKFSRLVL